MICEPLDCAQVRTGAGSIQLARSATSALDLKRWFQKARNQVRNKAHGGAWRGPGMQLPKVPGNWVGVVARIDATTEEVKSFFDPISELIRNYSWEVSIGYMFTRV